MFKKIIYKIALFLIRLGLNTVYDYVDKNKDGKIDKEEIKIVHDKIKNIMKQLKK